MTTPEHRILEYRSPAALHQPVIGDESADAREIFGWLFVSLVAVPAVFGLVFALGSVLR